jgi:endogenous inhibitor of DNA gyrase (YacG/DUF329 family)
MEDEEVNEIICPECGTPRKLRRGAVVGKSSIMAEELVNPDCPACQAAVLAESTPVVIVPGPNGIDYGVPWDPDLLE